MSRLPRLASLVVPVAFCACALATDGEPTQPTPAARNATPTAIDPGAPLLAEGESAFYFADGALRARGKLNADGTREGKWTFYFPSGRTHWEARFRAGAFLPDQSWVEFNADGSVRADSTDGEPLAEPPAL